MSVELKKGDLVLFKSGGPVMTVIGPATSPESVTCGWHVASTGQFETAVFDCSLLIPIAPPESDAGPGPGDPDQAKPEA